MTTPLPREQARALSPGPGVLRSEASLEQRLPGGRVLGLTEYGPRDGTPLFYFHGTPSSRLEWEAFTPAGLADDLGLRVIAPERPGMGRSDFQRSRRVVDWPVDVAHLADTLGIARFFVLGYSGGAAYAAACGASLTDRVLGVALVSPVCHDESVLETGLDQDTLRIKRLCHDRPAAARIMLEFFLGLPARVAPRFVISQTRKALPEVDRDVLARPGVDRAYVAAVAEAFRGGARGPQHDMSLLLEPWTSNLGAITAPVTVWQGEQDRLSARPAMARYLCDRIRGSRLTLLDEGHISVWANHTREVLGRRRAVGDLLAAIMLINAVCMGAALAAMVAWAAGAAGSSLWNAAPFALAWGMGVTLAIVFFRCQSA